MSGVLRVMKTDAAKEAMRKPLNPVSAVIKATEAAKLINMPVWKVCGVLNSEG